MKNRKPLLIWMAPALAALGLTLAACGGGGTGPEETASPEPPAQTGADTAEPEVSPLPQFDLTEFIVIDQFGYRPGARKTAVIRSPKDGPDAHLSFAPGSVYRVVSEDAGAAVYEGAPEHKFDLDPASGDEIWWFDFSAVSEPGRYYILDAENGVRSFAFTVAEDVYNDVLRHAVRMFFYQRAGFAKEAEFAGEGWADGASHLQDGRARYFYDRDNPDTERDLSGGWYDAGDYNKYTSWTARYVEEMLESYRETPGVFTDGTNIPESGNGVPDIIDEARWGMDYLLKLQNDGSYRPTVLPNGYPDDIVSYDGSLLSVVTLSNRNDANGHASPPSTAAGMTLYGPPNTTSAYAAARAFALGAVMFAEWDAEYAERLRDAAVRAWSWAEANPDVMFHNNNAANRSQGLAAGDQEIGGNSTGARSENRMKAALYLFEMTGNAEYLSLFEDNYRGFPLFNWWFMDHYRTSQHTMYFQYINLSDADPAIAGAVREQFLLAFNREDSHYAPMLGTDGYRAFLDDYPWGSNRAKSEMGLTFYQWAANGMEPDKSPEFLAAAEDYLHYIHGVNPFNWVYLTNMNGYGASKSLTSIYHDWFSPNTPWDIAGVSEVGPAPGYLPGGPNQGYNVQSGFPDSLGGYTPTAEELELGTDIQDNLVGSPPAKMYIDINHSWPINTWEITEPSNGYQMAYIRLLSKFAKPLNAGGLAP